MQKRYIFTSLIFSIGKQMLQGANTLTVLTHKLTIVSVKIYYFLYKLSK